LDPSHAGSSPATPANIDIVPDTDDDGGRLWGHPMD